MEQERQGIPMNFSHLEYIVAIAKCGSISQAAQKLLVSQPYLSGMIKNLEDELGFPIFQRNYQGIQLTKPGADLIKSAKKILSEVDKIYHIAAEQQAPLTVAAYYAPFTMRMFLQFISNPRTHLADKIYEMGNQEIFQSVHDGVCSLGIVCFAASRREKYIAMAESFQCQCIALHPMIPTCAMMSKEHPLAKKAEIRLEELRQYPYVVYEDESSRALLNLLGISDHTNILQVSGRAGLFDAVYSGGYITAFAMNPGEQRKDLAYIPLVGNGIHLTMMYVIQKGYILTKREKDFVVFLKKGYQPENGGAWEKGR